MHVWYFFFLYLFFLCLVDVLFPLSVWFCCSLCRQSISWLVPRLSISFTPIPSLSLSSCFLLCLCFCCFPILPTQSIRQLASSNCFTLSYSFFFFVERVDSPVYQVGRSRALFLLLGLWFVLFLCSCVKIYGNPLLVVCNRLNLSLEYSTG